MADNVNLPGTGKDIAADDISSVWYQRVKLTDGTADSTTSIPGDASGLYVQGADAHDAPAAGKPFLIALRASAAAPSDVSADNDVVRAWALRNGAQVVNLSASGTLITATGGLLDVNTELTTADLDTGAGSDTRAVMGIAIAESGGAQLMGSAKPLPTYEIAPATVLAAQVTVTNSTTQILGTRATRKSATIVNRQTVAIYIGATAATTSMFRLDPGDSYVHESTSRLDGITSAAYSASGDAQVHTIENY